MPRMHKKVPGTTLHKRPTLRGTLALHCYCGDNVKYRLLSIQNTFFNESNNIAVEKI